MNKYLKQAREFLLKTKTTLTIERGRFDKTPNWLEKETDNYGNYYTCQLSNDKGKYVFDFWGSIKDKEENKRPTIYDVLACLSVYDIKDYYDFCSTFGYQPSHKAEKIYNEVIKQEEELKKLFTGKGIIMLNDIN